MFNAQAWVEQELSKITNIDLAKKHIDLYNAACTGFFLSEAGKASAKRDPAARQARHDLAAAVKAKFSL